MKKLLIKLKIRNLKKKGYESFSITVNGTKEDLIFYNPNIIYKYSKERFNY